MGQTKKKLTIGIDVGGTKILVCLFNRHFKLLSEIKLKTKPDKGSRFFIDSMAEAVRHVLREGRAPIKEVAGIGVGCPGFIDPEKGVIAASPNIPFLKHFPLAKRLSKATGLPVTLGNDAQTGLYGEHQLGVARGKDNVVGIFIGTGIGGAIILNGQIYRGTSGSAGEVGHVKMETQGPACGCGGFGCLEAYAGRLAIASEASALSARQAAPYLRKFVGTDVREIKSGALARSIRAGDEAVANLVRHKAKRVGMLMANLVNVLNPDMIVLGGGVVEAMPSLIARQAEKSMKRYALPTSVKHVKVAVSTLGDHAIAMGAAKRAQVVFSDRRDNERRHG